MDFDLSKENIQPLRGGRNMSQLGVALQAQMDVDHQKELITQREKFETLIKTYSGDDPLENWYNYITWIEQSYPKQGHEGNLIPLLEECLKTFEKDERYREDRRLCKLFIKYIDHQQNPVELYQMMHAQGLCNSCADMYKAWAYYYEAAGDYQNADRVFQYGKRAVAQPYDELENAHKNLIIAAGQHMIYGPNEQDLSEKRQALTSLAKYKSGHVGSLRKIADVVSLGVSVEGRSNTVVPIYEDKGEEVKTNDVGPVSVITAARRLDVPKENTLKPGPWTTLPNKKKEIFKKQSPSFTVHEDNEDHRELSKFNNLVSATSESYSDWIVSLTIPEPRDDKLVRFYPREKVYCEISTEYSLEELRAVRYRSNRKQHGASFNNINLDIPYNENNKNEYVTSNTKTSFEDQRANENGLQLFQKNFSGSNQRELKYENEWRSPKKNHLNRNAQSRFPEMSPAKDTSVLNFDLWNSFSDETSSNESNAPKCSVPKFAIYEQPNIGFHQNIEPKGSAMKTPFKDLNSEELAETGSRGGMDVAAAAPVDSARRLHLYDEDNVSSSDKNVNWLNCEDFSCNTQMFGFNLNVMQVSTPQSKQEPTVRLDDNIAKTTAKKLFSETSQEAIDKRSIFDIRDEEEKCDKILSTILEETQSCGQSTTTNSNNGTTTKSSLLVSSTKNSNMATISEEHNRYLEQNLMVNAALRSSSLGDLMDFPHQSPRSLTVPHIQPKLDSYEERILEPTTIAPLDFIPSDPFKQKLIEQLLERVGFPGRHTQGFYYVSAIPKLSVRKESVSIGADKYIIEKQLGKGTYGTVFRGIDAKTGRTVAVKIQKPPNKWEFYICRELRVRLLHHPLKECFMDVRNGYFSDGTSVLISNFMPCGSLLDVANTVKQKSGRPMKESLCIHFCLEMLRIVQAMHEVKIIHADIKPDNFLVQLLPNDAVGLQLIDFGCSIDMSLFPPDAFFSRKVTTEDFVCCEMKDNRPWNYHTDLFCIAATAHVLLFDKYIQLQKKSGHWTISNRLPRYARVDLWNIFFSTLLNQQEGPADSVPLQAMLEDSLNHKFDDYHNELRYLTNILKNR